MPKLDLFTAHLNHHLPVWIAHPMAAAPDALIQYWTGLFLNAFPLIPLLERTLIKIREDHVEVVALIAPTWGDYHEIICLLRGHARSPSCSPHRMVLQSQHRPVKGTVFRTDLKTIKLIA